MNMNMDYNKNEFIKYTDGFSVDDKMIKLKTEHTLRVANLCFDIAGDIGLDDDGKALAYFCGLLHDIGRFEQWKNYKSFDDSKSVDHADYGYKLLKNKNLINKFKYEKEDEELILTAVKYHNKLSIPTEIDKKSEMFLKIVRDADKLDIMYLYSFDDSLIKIDDSTFSSKILSDVFMHQKISFKNKKTKVDSLAIPVGFLYDFNFDISYKILKDRNYYNSFIDIYKVKNNNELFLKQIEDIRDDVNKFIDERVREC